MSSASLPRVGVGDDPRHFRPAVVIEATGRPRTTELRMVVDAFLYIAWTDCQWRALPERFPSVSTVQRYFYAGRDSGLWRTINVHLVTTAPIAVGREASPAAGAINS
ncbi:MAG: transposase [Telmatospirillum sp.]|nr:transposase [Telmatospirillum sp.]